MLTKKHLLRRIQNLEDCIGQLTQELREVKARQRQTGVAKDAEIRRLEAILEDTAETD